MASNSRVLTIVILIAVALAAALGFYLWRQWEATRPLPPPQAPVEVPDSIPVDNVPVSSPNLELNLIGMRGTVHPEYTDWACLLECRERAGCEAVVEVRVGYRSNGVPQQLVIGGRLSGEVGEIMRLGRAQRPPVAVDGIDSVDVIVIQVFDGKDDKPIIDD